MAAKRSPARAATPVAPATRSGTQWTYEERKARGKRMLSIYFEESGVEELDALVSDDGSSRNVVLRELVSAETKRRAKRSQKM